MDILTYVGLVIFAALFVFSGVNHIKNHTTLAGYTATAMGDCPVAPQLGYLGGWPTGVLLVGLGVGAALGKVWALYGLAAFLVLATVLFHRTTLKDPGTQKGIALIGAALALASLVK